MTIASRVTIKADFENGDRPQASDYADWIDSFLHLSDSTAQSVTSPLTLGTVGITTVSAQTGSILDLTASAASITGKLDAATVSAQAINGSAANFSTVSAQAFTGSAANFSTVSAQRVNGSAATFLAIVSAGTVHANTLIIGAETTASTSAIPSRFVRVTVSGTQYWLPLYQV